VPRHGIGQQLQRSSAGSTPHDRITIPQICSSRSLPLHRPRRSVLRYPAIAANRSPTHSVQRHLRLIHEPLPLRPTRWIGSIPITHLIRGIQIPIANAAPSTFPLPRFPPWEVCVRRPPSARRHHHGAGIRKPSPKLPIRDVRWTVAFEEKAEVAPISHFGSVCRVGPGNFTPSLSQIRT
jgi:hypothetical protein